jgi:MtaA/CmuA family methyltransferase
MNSYERVMARLRGEPVDRPPNFNIMMQFATTFIEQPFSAYYQDHRVLCAANFAVQEAFKLDILQAISDPYREAADFGAQVEFPDDSLPLCAIPLLVESSDLRRLKPPDPHTGRRMSDRIAAVRHFREQAGGQIPIMGWVEGALAEAADLRGVGTLLTDLYDRPAWVYELLEICTEVEIAFAKAQIAAGADIIGLGDAIASQVSPKAYRQFALPYEQRIFATVHEMGALARLHICGNTSRILADMAQSGADIIDVDWMVDMGQAAAIFGDRTGICGNQDPVAVMLNGSPEDVRRITHACMNAGGPRSISAAGCEIPLGTPHANLLAQAAALAAFCGSSVAQQVA